MQHKKLATEKLFIIASNKFKMKYQQKFLYS